MQNGTPFFSIHTCAIPDYLIIWLQELHALICILSCFFIVIDFINKYDTISKIKFFFGNIHNFQVQFPPNAFCTIPIQPNFRYSLQSSRGFSWNSSNISSTSSFSRITLSNKRHGDTQYTCYYHNCRRDDDNSSICDSRSIVGLPA